MRFRSKSFNANTKCASMQFNTIHNSTQFNTIQLNAFNFNLMK